jgi:hypothetical protein
MTKSFLPSLVILALTAAASLAGDYYTGAQPASYGAPSQGLMGGADGGLSATATPFRYSYLEGGWSRLDPKGIPQFDGYWIGGSFSPAEHFFVWGQWQQHSWEIIDISLLQGGIGFYVPITERVDWVTKLGYGKFAAGLLGFKDTATGYTGYTGLRIGFTDRLEAQAGVDAQYVEQDLSLGGTGALLFGVTDKVKLIAQGTYFKDQIDYGAGVRFEFQ